MTPRISAVAAVCALLVGCGGEPSPWPSPPSNILFITVDTLRADHLSAYGYVRDTSPVLDRLAAEGVRFDRAAVQWPKTGPSFASMFTSTYGKDNGITREVGLPLPGRFRMLAEELQAAGYGTHAVVSNGAVAGALNFSQGFDSYVETWKVPPDEEMPRRPNRAERVTGLALALADGIDRERPYFLWAHYLDPHTPYNAPGEAKNRFVGDEFYDATEQVEILWKKRRQQMTAIGYSQAIEGQTDLAFYVARYDAEIAYADAWIGTLLDGLEERGLLENTLIVMSSDHGESLGEHRYYFDHGRFGYQTCLRVPLIFHYPGVLEPRVDPAPAALLDLTPTLLEVAGVELPDGRWMQGRSLTPRLFGAAAGGEPVYSEAGYAPDDSWQKVVQDERYKLVWAQALREQRWLGGDGVEFVLFDLLEDPDELVNMAEERPEELRRLQRVLADWHRAERFDAERDHDDTAEGELDEETRKQLEALGYL